MPSQLNATPSTWKQEVNRRIAAHRNRKGPARVEPEMQTGHRTASSRAAEALARVNARYANAPSYNEILAGDAMAAIRAAETASRAAAEAQAAAENLLAGLHAASAAEFVRQSEALQPIQESFAAAIENEPVEPRAYAVRWEDTLPELHREPAASGDGQAAVYEIVPEGWREAAGLDEEREHSGVEVVEAGHPIPGNLIEFPSELVATRRVRPRRMEGPLNDGGETAQQLSIFEVDPATVSTVVEEPVPSTPAQASIWQEQEWPSIELPAETEEELLELQEQRRAKATSLDPAPASMRILAAVVDATLVAGSFLAAAAAAVWCGLSLPGLHTIEMGSAVGLLMVGLLYASLFYMLGDGTPGMYYAHLRLVSFEGRRTCRMDRLVRMAGLALSALPFGLGLAWMLFDEEHLCWHDRLSKTYMRRY
ncbi:MAG: RDD family protein [Terracidiphilus sp.]|nr:RDD family protein [Terracidiphilus sp.]